MLDMFEIMASFDNGQKKQFYSQVKEVGQDAFACALHDYADSGDLEPMYALKMLKTFILLDMVS